MTRTETIQIMSVLKAAYPSYYKDMKRTDADAVVDLWASMFAEEQLPIVAAAVKALIASDAKGFPPVIGQVKAYIRKLTQPEQLNEAEAWGYVMKALRNSTYNSADEFEKMPEIARRLVGTPNQLKEWAMIDIDELQTVTQSNFMRSYRARATSEREYLALPSDVKQMMSQIAAGFDMKRLEE